MYLTKQSALDALTKGNAKQVQQAIAIGDAAYLARTLSVLHRSASSKQRQALEAVIDHCSDWRLFTNTNGALTTI